MSAVSSMSEQGELLYRRSTPSGIPMKGPYLVPKILVVHYVSNYERRVRRKSVKILLKITNFKEGVGKMLSSLSLIRPLF
ncbi:hypothetical protein MGYG_03877 [Nannizzia gypsea CBS 118893]|uniref:Uncharacterized protein n=1 Tax=Arthroderma gypseum (strain ATCC MYA-4604 / CBS 118893) TaxID=535722 RepID=E4UUA7_ARTGP|nr:hypothetical protein MGYG_03877 [Nannizzia gypsea CBS 118893]EFR00874.1 hypothetical protein MGYG_03877 [Nannizzia gypsea CBS 118893]